MKILDNPDRLLREAQAGRPDCAAIYRLVRRPMYVAVWRCLRPSQSYGGFSDDDVVAIAFDQLIGGGLDGAKSLLGKARVIAFRRAVDLVRRRNHEECHDCLEHIEDDDELADELERREFLATRAVLLLDRLPDGQRLAIVETVMKCRTCTDVAAQLDVSHQAVSKARKKGLEHLLIWLVDEDPLDGRPPEEESG